jgi:hypothetical protein
MVKLLQMSKTDHLTQPLCINFDDNQKREPTEYGFELKLYQNKDTGESVQMCWIESCATFPVDDLCRNGEELFIYNGSLITEDGDTFSNWGWLRFPASVSPSTKRTALKAGTAGPQVYRKTGHLTEAAIGMEKIQITDDDEV